MILKINRDWHVSISLAKDHLETNWCKKRMKISFRFFFSDFTLEVNLGRYICNILIGNDSEILLCILITSKRCNF